jgi:uncharacterized protein YjbJ (UPF0337 family)
MDEDRMTGTAKNLGGKVEEGFGRATGDRQTQFQGKATQLEGTLQDLYGQAKDTAAETVEVVRERAGEAEDFLRSTIEQRPVYDRRRLSRDRILDRIARAPRPPLVVSRSGPLRLFETTSTNSIGRRKRLVSNYDRSYSMRA